MSAYADLSLKDAAAVEHTFYRKGRDDKGVFRWRYDVVSDIAKCPQVTASMKPVGSNTPVARGVVKFTLPAVDANGLVTGEAICTLSFAIPTKDLTSTDRGNLLAYVADAINTETPIRNMIANLDPVW